MDQKQPPADPTHSSCTVTDTPDSSPLTPRSVRFGGPPLNGIETHPLTPHAISELRHIQNHGPVPANSINAGVRDRFHREALVETVLHPSPYVTHKKRHIDHFIISPEGRQRLTEIDAADAARAAQARAETPPKRGRMGF